MYLTPQQKAIGAANFQAAIGSGLLRREFLQTGLTQGIASGAGLGPHYFGYGKTVDRPLRVGVLGTGDEGCVLIGAINRDFLQVVAIADIRPYNVHRAFHGDYESPSAHKARRGLLEVYGWTEDNARKNVKVYGPYQDLLREEKDIEAVIIALPLNLHAPAAIAAMRAGRHVLTEKLMAHSVHECKEMARVASQTKLLLATGHQRHYSILYDHAIEAIRKGLLGDIHYIRAQWHRDNLPGNDSWQQPMPKRAKPEDPQAEALATQLADAQRQLDAATKKKDAKQIDLWTKRVAQKKKQIEDELIRDKVKDYGYQDKRIEFPGGVYQRPAIEELIRWRLWDRTGGGLMAELGSHQLDAASLFIAAMHEGKKQHPLCVSAASGRPLFPADRDVEDHVYCLFEFPAPGYNPQDPKGQKKKITVAYASINGNGFGGYGETVFGTRGTLLLEREQEAMLYETSAVDAKTRVIENKDKETKSRHPLAITQDEKGDPVSAAIGGHALAGDISRGYTEELEHWAWCIRNPAPENQPRCHPTVALADAVIALTTNLAAKEQRRIDFQSEWFDPDRDETPEGDKPDLTRYT